MFLFPMLELLRIYWKWSDDALCTIYLPLKWKPKIPRCLNCSKI